MKTTTTIKHALSAVPDISVRSLVRHRDIPGGYGFVECFLGDREGNGFAWKVYVRPVEQHADKLLEFAPHELQTHH